MAPEEIIVLSITIATFVAFGIWAITFGRRLRFPKGKRVTIEGGIVTVHVVGAVGELVAQTAADAVKAAWSAWKQDRGTPPYNEFCVLFLPDDQYDELDEQWGRKTAAHLGRVTRAIGTGIPCPVIRMSKSGEVARTGEPVIHEMMHALLQEFSSKGANRDHKTEGVWAEVSHKKSVQFKAREWFKTRDEL